MSTVAIIPARGGSQGVPGKNLRPIGGVPLIARAVRACRAARRIDEIYVTTDDADIAAVARTEGARIIERPAELAGHTATSESALLHALDAIADRGVDARTLVFVQCTSPFIDPHDLDAGVELVAGGAADTAFSGIETYEFLWRDADPATAPGTGAMVGQNHDARVRPRRQDRRPDHRETGAFYVMDVEGFRLARHRFFGTTRVVPVSELASLEIDTAEELALADAFAGVLDRPSAPARDAIGVDVVFSAFDGVFTTGERSWNSDGTSAVTLFRPDVLGLRALAAAGVAWVVVDDDTAAPPPAHLGLAARPGDPATAIDAWLTDHGIAPDRAAFVASDVDATHVLPRVGWPIATPDAPHAVQTLARLGLTHPGGRGAVRELADRILTDRSLADRGMADPITRD